MKKLFCLCLLFPSFLFAEIIDRSKIDKDIWTIIESDNDCKSAIVEFKELYRLRYSDICLVLEDYIGDDIIVMPEGFPLHMPFKKTDINIYLQCENKRLELYMESRPNNSIVETNKKRNNCILTSILDGEVL